MVKETFEVLVWDHHTGWGGVEYHEPTPDPMVWNHSLIFPNRATAWTAAQQETQARHPVRVTSSLRGEVWKNQYFDCNGDPEPGLQLSTGRY